MSVKPLDRKGKPRKIEILPREPLTKKARAAIMKYVILAGEKNLPITYYMVNACLAAERMRRSDLYLWLESRGYTWFSRAGCWDFPRAREGR